ncbi:hypothetical protein V8G54_022946 [Vigna mungo]|uniref:Albumin I chain a domain-containing protein n=1 Tax=Vigna mungo TaxID=3915 RepID=A0AAQ3N425_VIGMU
MAYARLAPLALYLLATSIIFPMKIEAADCSGVCSPFEMPPCGSSDCRCIPAGGNTGICYNPNRLSSSVAKMIDEHPNLCQSDDECMKKGSGNFCARYPNNYIDYGLCFDSDSEALKGFLAMPAAITK